MLNGKINFTIHKKSIKAIISQNKFSQANLELKHNLKIVLLSSIGIKFITIEDIRLSYWQSQKTSKKRGQITKINLIKKTKFIIEKQRERIK